MEPMKLIRGYSTKASSTSLFNITIEKEGNMVEKNRDCLHRHNMVDS